MRRALWPESNMDEHREEARGLLAKRAAHTQPYAGGAPAARDDQKPRTVGAPCLLVFAGDEHAGAERVLGFAEWSLRAYAEGCASDRVAYLEGWYVIPEARGRGVGAALVAGGEAWGREQGCTEAASDAELDNTVSINAHKALGFEDLGPVRLFRKDL